ncbi:hypothetical protein DFH27DRAFT_615088 [Peziza echinospora]|nr:hypothetical protein DFH27DRAFT_615088 [Peziza echinospora]
MGASKTSRKKKAAKGQENGNGLSPTAKAEKTTTASRRSSPSASPSPQPETSASKSRGALSIIGRLLAWYTLFTVLFRCPSSPNASSPTICHGYTQAHDLLAPHLQPYYDTYASPYVEKLMPIISHANQVYINPAVAVASAHYEKYAQPAVAKAKAITEKEYHEKLEPHVIKASKKFNVLYDQHVAPHSDKVSKIVYTAAESPYWGQAKEHAEDAYHKFLIPTYHELSPYVHQGLESAKHIYVVVLGPHIRQGAKVGGEWFERNVWTGASGIWREYVEVQLERIRERLSSGNISTDGYAHSSVSQSEDSSEGPSAADPVPTEESPERKAAREAARKQIEADLAFYTEKFDKHANEAIASLHAHVDELATSAKASKEAEIAENVAQLDQLIDRETNALKAVIIDLAKKNQPAATPEETKENTLAAFDKLFAATRDAGALVKESVQKLRWDSQRFLAGVYDEVAAAADTRIEQVDALIDSGIGELGMKWAWNVDGVTYKDWARYHDLKKEFSGIRAKVIKAAEKNEKLMSVTAWAEGDDWETGVVKRATDAALELARLKRIGKKKIEQGDFSDDFSDRYISGGAGNKKITEAETEAEKAEIASQDPAENVVKLAVGVADAAEANELHETYDQNAVGQQIQQAAEIFIEEAKEVYEQAAKAVQEKVDEAQAGLDNAAAAAQSIVGEGYDSASKVVEDGYNSASKVVVSSFTPPPALENIIAATNLKIHEITNAAMERIYGREKTTFEKATDAFESAIHGVSEIAEDARERVSHAIFGKPVKKESNYEKAARIVGDKVDGATVLAGEKFDEWLSYVLDNGEKKDEAEEAYYSSLLASANARVQGAVAEAREKLSQAYEERKKAAQELVDTVVGTAPVAAVTDKVKEMYRDVKDEL